MVQTARLLNKQSIASQQFSYETMAMTGICVRLVVGSHQPNLVTYYAITVTGSHRVFPPETCRTCACRYERMQVCAAFAIGPCHVAAHC